MDTTKIINLVLPDEIFGNYWIVNTKKDNLASVQASSGNWVLKSNSDVKVFRNGTAVDFRRRKILYFKKCYSRR